MDKKEILERKLSQLEDLTWEEQKEMFSWEKGSIVESGRGPLSITD